MGYERTQRGFIPVLVTLPVLGVLLAVTLIEPDGGAVAVMVAASLLVLVIVLLFSRLTVSVGSSRVRAAFGLGWPAREIALSDIRAVRTVRNRWYHGWGIRLIPDGSVYNVAGYDAVELDLASGKKFRIGTDEPEVLAAAIVAAAPLVGSVESA